MTATTEITSIRGLSRTFSRNTMGMIGLVLVLSAILMAVFAPQLAPYDPYAPVKVTIDDIYAPPSADLHSSNHAGWLLKSCASKRSAWHGTL